MKLHVTTGYFIILPIERKAKIACKCESASPSSILDSGIARLDSTEDFVEITTRYQPDLRRTLVTKPVASGFSRTMFISDPG